MSEIDTVRYSEGAEPDYTPEYIKSEYKIHEDEVDLDVDPFSEGQKAEGYDSSTADDPDNNFAKGGVVSGGHISGFQWPQPWFHWPSFSNYTPPRKLVKTVEFYDDGKLVKKELHYE